MVRTEKRNLQFKTENLKRVGNYYGCIIETKAEASRTNTEVEAGRLFSTS